ncbi:MAG: DUF3822 family protein [Sphingobacteriales bacterium]|nr:DUF3822 family protein [Sphingobacteriales bacterium]
MKKSKLCIFISDYILAYAVCDMQDCVQRLKSYPLYGSSYLHDFGKLKDILDKDELLSSAYRFDDVSIALSGLLNTFVPHEFFDGSDLRQYFDFNLAPQHNVQLRCDEIRGFDYFNIYAIDHALTEVLDRSFEDYTLKHAQSVLLSSVLKDYLQPSARFSSRLIIHRESNHLDIFWLQAGKLQFINRFVYQSAEDFLYYVLSVIFGKRPSRYTYCPEMALIPQQKFYNLFSV